MKYQGKRKISSAVGAMALMLGTLGAVLGVSIVAATSAGAATPPPSGTYTCTVSDAANASVPAVTYTGSFPAPTNNAPLLGVPGVPSEDVTPGDPINFNCSSLTAHEGIAIVQANSLAGYDNPVNQQEYADLTHGNTGAAATAGGTLNANLNSTYANDDSNVGCPGSQTSANVDAGFCIATAADIGTEGPLVVAAIVYTTTNFPAPPAIGINSVNSSPTSGIPTLTNGVASTLTFATSSGSWYGAGPDGAGNEYCPVNWVPNPAYDPVNNPNVPQVIDGGGCATGTPVPIQAMVSGPSSVTANASALGVKHVAYCQADSAPTSCAAGTTPGTYNTTIPLSLDGSVSLPAITTPGLYSVTITEGAGPSATAKFFVSGASATIPPSSVPSGHVGPHTSITVGPTTGWAPDSTTTWSAQWVPDSTNTTCTESPIAISPSNFTASPAYPTDDAGTESFTVNDGDILAATFNDPNCIPGAWDVQITQHVSDPLTAATATAGPINLVNLTSQCPIASTGSCLVQQGLSEKVTGTELTVTEYSATEGVGAPGQNPSAILVNLSPVTLGPGVFQAAQGELNTVRVNDARGSLSGWTVTGIMASDFNGPAVGLDNVIPADYLTWNPSVSLTYPGNLAAGVVPDGTVAPPAYGPDAPPYPCGTAPGYTNGGTNGNIPCPQVNDNAGASTNTAGSTQIGGSSPLSNHSTDPIWPTTGAEGPSGILGEVTAGPIANLRTSENGQPDYSATPALLCQAATGGGGGSFNCDASLSLAVPPYVAAGTYTATLDLLTTAT